MLRFRSKERIRIALALLAPLCYFPLGCAVSSSAGANSAAQQLQLQTDTSIVSPAFFGMVVQGAGTVPAVVTGARRLWDPSVIWAALEPQRGVFAWAALDAEVAAAEAAGAKITLVLGMTPAWASSAPSQSSAYGPGATAMPASLADWDEYVAAVATRYGGRITAYQVWDSPENSTEWSGSAASVGSDMATLAAHAATAVHAGDGAAQIVSPSLSPAALTAFLDAGGGTSVDAIAGSFDTAGAAPETMPGQLAALHAAAAAAGVAGKPVWNEQASWALPQDGLDSATQAAWVARALLLSSGYGVARMDWFAWNEHAANTLQMSDAAGQPTQAALGYGVVEGWLSGAQANGCTSTAEGLWTCGLVRDGQTEWVVWSTAGTVETSALGESAMMDISGNQSSVGADGRVSVGASPVLLQ